MGSLGKTTGAFSEARFIGDVEKMCLAVGAPFSESTTRKVLETYPSSFLRGAINWRTTNRRGDALNYRFYERKNIDTITPAIEAGLLDPTHPLLPLLKAWGDLYDGTVEQSCDFCAKKGLVKCWLYFGPLKPTDDILGAPGIPSTITRHKNTLHSLGLDLMRHIAVDYYGGTVNLYFTKKHALSPEGVRSFVALASPEQAAALAEDEIAHMTRYLSPDASELAVTVNVATGSIKRVAIYVFLAEQVQCIRGLGSRLTTFFANAPCYDDESGDILSWSFGGERYVKGERNYCGDTVSLMRDWSLPR
ncbi:hypothetical protein J7T55_007880 [Diaporthe amygdali]|uniref:uncharacterized protein n=1 Tax=Phomopsis amygdali TaxID=1214568 RepID=UPI0022FE4B4C|nr:uncharacterized protein J7T55_007880 [Diaporthe amygdali]KAJ0114046.1 hypothetical protein J7T55_007880 [Diaporthe amygdali]